MIEHLEKLNGANMEIDLESPKGRISWTQDICPWNEAENTLEYKCAENKYLQLSIFLRG